MRKFFILILVFCSVSGFGSNAELGKDWNVAQQFYNDGDYRNAVITYNSILSSGVKSAQLYYNLGNAHFKSNEFGLAVLNYERALVLDPSMEDAAYNLGVTKAKAVDRIEILPTFFLVSWIEGFGAVFSTDTWAILCVVFLALAALGGLGWRLLDGAKRKGGLSMLIVGGVLAVVSFLYSSAAYNDIKDNNGGVVIVEESIVRSEPGGVEAFKIHSGTTFEFVNRVEAWSQIRLSDGRVAWVADKDVEAIIPL